MQDDDARERLLAQMLIPPPKMGPDYVDYCFVRTLEECAPGLDVEDARLRVATHWLSVWSAGSWWSRVLFWVRLIRSVGHARNRL